MEVIPFDAAHLDAMELRQSEANWLAADPMFRNKIEALAAYGTGGTLIHDSLIIATFGWYEMWPGHLAVWAFPSVHVQKYAMAYLRKVRRYIRAIEQDFKPLRIQSEAYADELHDNWMRFLGFECETPNGMKNYAVDGRTMNLWAKTYEREAA